MFIIDFDDTLFDTYSYKKDRVECLKKIGVSEELFYTTYKEAYTDKLNKNSYNNDNHAASLEKFGFDKKMVLAALSKVDEQIEKYIFPDTKEFLRSIKNLHRMILLSLGNSEFQTMKVKNAGIEEFFDEVYITDDSKEHVLTKILGSNKEEVWFVNDKIEETLYLVKKFPNLKPVLKMSPAFMPSEYKNSNIPFFSSLINIEEYVK